MGLLDDCETLFGTRSLYLVLGLIPDATKGQIKKAYRKLSLKYHPDRHSGSPHSKEQLTRFFQVLSKVHYILSDTEKRDLYDRTGLVDNEDSLENQGDWKEYFRALFPAVTKKDINGYLEQYIGSQEELDDIKHYYRKFEGDLDKISEYLIAFDENRVCEIIDELIESREVISFDAYAKEPESKRKKRQKRAQKEAKEAEKASKVTDTSNDLVNAIQKRSSQTFSSIIASLEAKYSTSQPPRKKPRKGK